MKASYKIPFPITHTGLNQEISLKFVISGHKIGFKNQIQIKDVFLTFGMGMAVFMIGSMTPIGSVIVAQVLFYILSLLMIWLLMKKQPNGERGYQWVAPLISYYFSKSDRYATSGQQSIKRLSNGKLKVSSNLIKMRGMYQLDAINETGIIHFNNGDYGQLYRIGGRMSLISFESDREQMIDSLHRLMNQWDDTGQFIIITQLMRQRTRDQQEAVAELRQVPGNDDATMKHLLDRRQKYLELVSAQYVTSQQYLLLRMPNERKLFEANEVWRSQMNVTGVLTQLDMLDTEETIHTLQNVYLGDTHEVYDLRKNVRRRKKRK